MSKPIVLIADDDADVRRSLRTRLASWGCEVIEAHDGLSTLAKSRTTRIDAFILDHHMPMGEGCTIAANIRNHSAAPIIFLSGCTAEEFRPIVTQLPDTYLLRKPCDERKLLELLASCTGTFAYAGQA